MFQLSSVFLKDKNCLLLLCPKIITYKPSATMVLSKEPFYFSLAIMLILSHRLAIKGDK